MPLEAKRRSIIIESQHSRVITRPYMHGPENRVKKVINRVLNLPEEEAVELLDYILQEFADRHRNFRETIEKHCTGIEKYLPANAALSDERRLLLGAYFTMEYSVESAALFNPSMVEHPDQSGLSLGAMRFIMSFRATGEGHISSIEFRSGIIDEENNIFFDPISDFLETAQVQLNTKYDRRLFLLKLNEMATCNEITDFVLEQLPSEFSFKELKEKISQLENQKRFPEKKQKETVDIMLWLARSNYELIFQTEHQISERVIYPVSENESRGIEDARFVRFTDDNGQDTYYATYTAYNGFKILPQLIETKDFVNFKIITLNGEAVQNKGMALFPRKINGQYVMLSRQDGENNHMMFSDHLHFWQKSFVVQEPSRPWEFIQIGNCGSPLETREGWLLLTHGVGPMRTYGISVELLDLEDPKKIIGRLKDPILLPDRNEREGYVPNVVYSCGGLIHNDELIIPYGMSDIKSGIATVPVRELLSRLLS